MIVVADTGPLNYLVIIEAVNILSDLYGRVLVPETVARELVSDGAPTVVRTWMSRPPDWFEVRPDPPTCTDLTFLDAGEAAALMLAESLGADLVLMDEREGRAEAGRRGLRVAGTLGVLADGSIAGLLDFDAVLVRLRATNFRLSAEVERAVKQRLANPPIE